MTNDEIILYPPNSEFGLECKEHTKKVSWKRIVINTG